MEKKLYMVETISIFRHRYVVNAYAPEHAKDEVVTNIHQCEDFKEFSQEHVDEVITSTREISATDYMTLFDEDNGYLKPWPDERKMTFINEIDYKEDK